MAILQNEAEEFLDSGDSDDESFFSESSESASEESSCSEVDNSSSDELNADYAENEDLCSELPASSSTNPLPARKRKRTEKNDPNEKLPPGMKIENWIEECIKDYSVVPPFDAENYPPGFKFSLPGDNDS